MIIPEAAIETINKFVAERMRVLLEHTILDPREEVQKIADDDVDSRQPVVCLILWCNSGYDALYESADAFSIEPHFCLNR